MAERGSYGAHELILTKAMLCDVSVGWGEVLEGGSTVGGAGTRRPAVTEMSIPAATAGEGRKGGVLEVRN